MINRIGYRSETMRLSQTFLLKVVLLNILISLGRAYCNVLAQSVQIPFFVLLADFLRYSQTIALRWLVQTTVTCTAVMSTQVN